MKRALPGVAMAVVLLASLAPAGPATAQQAPRPDLAVTRFVLLGPVPGWTDGAPNSTTVQVTVTNLGSAPASYRIDYVWVDSSGTRPLNEDASSSFDVGALAPGNSSTPPPVQWRLQPGQAGHGSVGAQVRVSDQTAVATDSDPSNDARGIPLFVAVHQMRFTMTGTAAEAPPDGVGFFRMTARNLGNVAEAVQAVLVDAPHDSRLHPVVDPGNVTVPPGATANVTLFVDYAPAGDFTPFSLHYGVEAGSGFGAPVRLTTPALTGGPEDAGTSGTSFHAAAEPSLAVVPRAGEGIVRLHLANDGTRPDAYRLEASAGPGWSVEPDEGAGSRVALYPGEQTRVPLHVRPPAGAQPGSTTHVEVRVHASQLPDPVLAAFEAQVPGAILEVEALRFETPSVYTGDRPRVLATVANLGDQDAQAGGALDLEVDPPGAAPVHLYATLDSLAPGQRAVEAFEILPFTAGGLVHAAVSLHDPYGNLAAQRSIDVFVHHARLALQAPEPMAGGPGELVAYRIAPHAFRVTNLGNAAERIEVEAQASEGSSDVEGSTLIDLAPAETRTLAVLHTLPSPLGGRSAANLTVVARVADRPGLAWEATVATGLRDQEAPRLWLDAAPPKAWPVATPLRLDVVAHDDDRVQSLRVTVTAPGNTSTTVDLAPAGADHWVGQVPLRVAGNHALAITAKDPAGNAGNLTFTVEARRQLPPPRLSLQGPGDGPVGDGTAFLANQSLRLRVDDDAGVSTASLEVRQGPRTIRRDLAVTAGVASFDLRDAAPGDAEVRIQAVDAAGLVSNLTVQVQVLPSEASPTSLSLPTSSRASPAAPLAGILAALAAAGALRRRRPA